MGQLQAVVCRANSLMPAVHLTAHLAAQAVLFFWLACCQTRQSWQTWQKSKPRQHPRQPEQVGHSFCRHLPLSVEENYEIYEVNYEMN